LLALEEYPPDPALEVVPDEVGGVVAEESAGRSERDDQTELHVSCAGQHAGCNHYRLARQQRKEHVPVGDREDEEVRPPRARDQVDELIEHLRERLCLRTSHPSPESGSST